MPGPEAASPAAHACAASATPCAATITHAVDSLPGLYPDPEQIGRRRRNWIVYVLDQAKIRRWYRHVTGQDIEPGDSRVWQVLRRDDRAIWSEHEAYNRTYAEDLARSLIREDWERAPHIIHWWIVQRQGQAERYDSTLEMVAAYRLHPRDGLERMDATTKAAPRSEPRRAAGAQRGEERSHAGGP